MEPTAHWTHRADASGPVVVQYVKWHADRKAKRPNAARLGKCTCYPSRIAGNIHTRNIVTSRCKCASPYWRNQSAANKRCNSEKNSKKPSSVSHRLRNAPTTIKCSSLRFCPCWRPRHWPLTAALPCHPQPCQLAPPPPTPLQRPGVSYNANTEHKLNCNHSSRRFKFRFFSINKNLYISRYQRMW